MHATGVWPIDDKISVEARSLTEILWRDLVAHGARHAIGRFPVCLRIRMQWQVRENLA